MIAGTAGLAFAQDTAQLADQELLRQQERERALREQFERRPDVHLPRQPGPAAAPVDATQDLPCFPVTQVVLRGDEAGHFEFAVQPLRRRPPRGGRAAGRAASVTNASATIETLGRLDLRTGHLLNTNLHFDTAAVSGASTPVIRLLHNGVEYDQSQIGTNFGALNQYHDRIGWRVLLPSPHHPFDRFPADVSTWAVPLQSASFPFMISGSPSCPGINGEGGCTSTAPAYADDHGIWQRFGVAPPPAYTGPACDAEYFACTPAQWTAFQQNHNARAAAYQALGAQINAYNESISNRVLREWTVLDLTQTAYTPQVTASDPGRIRVGGQLRLDAADSAVNDKSQIIVGGDAAITGRQLQSIDAQGTAITRSVGQAVRSYIVNRSFPRSDDRHYRSSPYISQVERTVSLPVALVQTRAAVTPAHTAPNPATSVNPEPTGLQGAVPVHAALGTRTVEPPLSLPASSLFRPRPEPTARYLIETDPRFADHRRWLGSDYLLQQLQTDPAMTHKRLGDGFYEQRLVAEQVAQLTGRRFLPGHADDQAQFRALMDAGATFAQTHRLRPGIALTPEQMAALTSDIVWLIEREVPLADGTRQKVLVPQVYMRVQPGDLDGSGTLLSADRLELDLTGDLINGGTLAGRAALAITAENVKNLGGRLTAQAVGVRARQDLDNLGGLIDAQAHLGVSAGRDLTIAGTTASTATQAGANLFERTTLDRVAGLYVSKAGATLLASAGRDLVLQAAQVSNDGAGGTTVLAAGRDLNLSTVATAEQDQIAWNAHNWRHSGQQQEVGSQVQATGDIALVAGRDLAARAASVTSEHGRLQAQAGQDLRLDAGQATRSLDLASQSQRKSLLSRRTTTTRDTVEHTAAQASTFSAETVELRAARDLALRGSDIVSTAGTTLGAAGDVTIEAATETLREQHAQQTMTSGVFSSGASLTLGRRQAATDAATTQTRAAGSTVGSVEGNVLIRSGGAYRQTGSDVLSPGGDVSVAARSILVEGAREDQHVEQTTRLRQRGLSLGASSPVIAAAQGAAQMSQAGSQTGDPRLQALAAGSAAMSVREAAQALSQGPQTGGGGFSVSLTVGGAKSESQLTQRARGTRASAIEAGGHVKLIAAGDGQDSHLTIRGSDVSAAGHATLKAEGDVILQSQAQSVERHSTERSRSAGVGLALTYGQGGWAAGFTANASAARSHADGQDVTHRHTEVNAGQSATVVSGRDTTLSGAQVAGERVTAHVGRALTVRSVQDTSTHDSRHQSAGGSVTLGYGFAASASLSHARVEGDHASVTQHSGIRAGDGGFEVQVQGHTELQGAVIASTQAAVDEGRNRLATGTLGLSDLTNRSAHDARGINLSGGYSYGGSGRSGASDSPASSTASQSSGVALQRFETGSQGAAAGVVSDSRRRASTTRSGISGGEITITDAAGQQERSGQSAEEMLARVNREVRSSTQANGLSQRWDGQQLQQQVRSGAQIVATFGQQAAKAVGDHAGRKADELRAQGNEEEAQKWDEGGAYRVAAHAVVGGLSGRLEGALGAGSSAAVAHALNEYTAHLSDGVRRGWFNSRNGNKTRVRQCPRSAFQTAYSDGRKP